MFEEYFDIFDIEKICNNSLFKGKNTNNGIKVLFIFDDLRKINEFLSIYNILPQINFNLDILFVENKDFELTNDEKYLYDFVLDCHLGNYKNFSFVGIENYEIAEIRFETEDTSNVDDRITKFKTEVMEIYKKFNKDSKMKHVTFKLKSKSRFKDKFLKQDKFLDKMRMNTCFDSDCYCSANFGLSEKEGNIICFTMNVTFSDKLDLSLFLRKISKVLSKYSFTFFIEKSIKSSEEVETNNKYYKSLLKVIDKIYPKNVALGVGFGNKNHIYGLDSLGKTYINYYPGIEKGIKLYYNSLIEELNRRSLCIVQSVVER